MAWLFQTSKYVCVCGGGLVQDPLLETAFTGYQQVVVTELHKMNIKDSQ